MTWYQSISELIDLRSFSNLWFWIALAVMWSTASHRVIGVPWDMIVRARRKGGTTAEDVEALVRINVNRLLLVAETSGTWLAAIGFFVLTSLALLSFVYAMEFAQAVLLLALPMSVVWLLSLRTARILRASRAEGEALYQRLTTHRLAVQALGMVSIFVTALWGMYQNFANGPVMG